jgi:AAA family ATP:ADP antiporter
VIRHAVARLVTVEEGEWHATLLAFVFFFCLLASYFILRSIRDALGVQAGVSTLPYLFTGTLLSTLALQPVSASLVARIPVRRFIPIVYRAFGVCLLFFAASLTWWPHSERWLAPTFFIWTSVFNLFVVSVFWGFMSDTFRSEQSKRLYGFISVGGTVGAMAGSALTALLAKRVGTAVLIVVSFVMLEIAVQCVRRFPASFRPDTRKRESEQRSVGGGSFSGITHVLGSPYLLGICLFMLLFTIGTTVLYFQQAEIVRAEFADRDSRTAFLAKIDLTVQTLTVLAQLFLTGRVIKWLGVGITLAILPVMSVIGFTTLGFISSSMALSAFVVFNVLRRAGNYGFASPGREVLFTVVSPEDKYKAKNFIDTFIYRSGDQIGAWSYAGLSAAGLAVSSISLIAAPMSAVWLFVALWLGRRHTRMQADELREADVAPVPEGAAVARAG